MVSIVIQAGGQSRRMGQDKGLIHLNNTPLIEHVLSSLRGIGDEIVITTNHPDNYAYLGIRLAADKDPGAGALPGLKTALEAAEEEYVFVIGCDMPFIVRELVEYIISFTGKADVVVPRYNGKYQPLHALYHRENCLPAINRVLSEEQFKLISFYPYVSIEEISANQIKPIDPDGRSFININTPEELAIAEKSFTQSQTAV